MRSPTGQSCSLGADKEATIIVVADVLWRGGEIFEDAVVKKTPVLFEFTREEINRLQLMFCGCRTFGEVILTLVNEAMRRKNMKFRLASASGSDGKFFCRVERR